MGLISPAYQCLLKWLEYYRKRFLLNLRRVSEELSPWHSKIAIHIDDFLEVFKEGVEKFKLFIKSDKEKEKVVCGRASKYFFTSFPSIPIEN